MSAFQETRPDHSPLKKLRADDRVRTPRHNSEDVVPPHKHIDRSKVDASQIQTPLVKIGDQSEREGPGPGFRGSPHKSHCWRKTLTSKDVTPINPELHISADDAYILCCSKRFVESVPGSCKKSLVVYDEGLIKYNMILSKYVCENFVVYSISSDWERFVKIHSLQAGDKMLLYRISEKSYSADHCYILKYVRECSDSKDVDAQKSKRPRIEHEHKKVELKATNQGSDAVDNKRKRDVSMPYCSRHMKAMTREAYFLSKTLTSIEVVHENAKLYFDPYEASILTDTSELGRYPLSKYSTDLQVFDKNGRTYFMTLSHCVSGGEIRSYCISAGWKRFCRAHKLKEGDVLTFYRFRDTATVRLKYYYVLKYFRKPPDVDQCMNNKANDNAKITWKGTLLMEKKQDPKFGDNEVPMENACDQKKINKHESGARKLSDIVEPCKNSKATEDPDKKDKHNGSSEDEVGNIAQKDIILVSKKNWEPEIRDNEVRMENDCDREKINMHGLAGSRDLTYGAYCLSKTLSACALVHEGNLNLCFDANEAWLLTDCPRVLQNHLLGTTFLTNLVVFDTDGREYNMVLSCCRRDDNDDRELVYTLDCGWQRFVRVHNLKAGDKIFIYRSREKSGCGEFSYYIKYSRNPAGFVRPELNGMETGGSGGALNMVEG